MGITLFLRLLDALIYYSPSLYLVVSPFPIRSSHCTADMEVIVKAGPLSFITIWAPANRRRRKSRKQRQRQVASCLSCFLSSPLRLLGYLTQAIAHQLSYTPAVSQHYVFIFRPFQGPSSIYFPNGRPYLELQIDA